MPASRASKRFIHCSVSTMCSTMRLLPPSANAGRQRWNWGRSSCHLNSPLTIRGCGNTFAATRWSMEMCQKGAGNIAWRIVANEDLPELDAPFSRMILPGGRAPGRSFEVTVSELWAMAGGLTVRVSRGLALAGQLEHTRQESALRPDHEREAFGRSRRYRE